jgi:hypothetical protein
MTSTLIWRACDTLASISKYYYPFPIRWNVNKQNFESSPSSSKLLLWRLTMIFGLGPFGMALIFLQIKLLLISPDRSDTETFHLAAFATAMTLEATTGTFIIGCTLFFFRDDICAGFNLLKKYEQNLSKGKFLITMKLTIILISNARICRDQH